MDRNTEEAIRCKGLAEKKMQDKEFSVARQFLLMAQQLCKDLDNISQMLAVCDVHCSAESKLLGNNEVDWYGILQVVETADVVMIKKQFRKFALLLHPDKNKFPGAESAFKLIGEAQTVLSDKTKRYLHDVKRRCAASMPPPPSINRTSYGSQFGYQNGNRSGSTSSNSRRPEAPKGYGNSVATFWTLCPHCKIRFQYYMQAINKSINCYACSKPFMAYDVNVHDSPSPFHFSQPVYPKNHGYQTAPKAKGCTAGNAKQEFPKKETGTSELNPEKVESKKQKRQEKESSKSCKTESGVDFAQEVSADKVGMSSGNPAEQPRRSGRNRGKVSYKENIDDDEYFESDLKKAKVSGFTFSGKEGDNGLVEDATKRSGEPSADSDVKTPVKLKDNGPESMPKRCNEPNVKTEESKGNDSGNSSVVTADSTSVPGFTPASEPSPMHVCPDPEFNNFDRGRDESCFSKGQIWAVYDNLDVMPRFYARIRKVFSSSFKLRITWLEPDPDDKREIEWVCKGLPTACGKFKLGETENTEDRLMFSHLVCWSKGSQRDNCNIFPRTGETWALFRNWDVKWIRNPDANRAYEFEFVEIVADYAEGVGVWVTYLGKLKGFVSLFCQVRKDGLDKFLVPPDELFRFSHSIRSFKMTGEEREGVPKGSLELDPASFPENVKEIEVTEDILVQVDNVQLNNSGPRSSAKTRPEDGISINKTVVNDFEPVPDCVTEYEGSSEDSSIEDVDVPDPEFFDFDKEKATDKFCVGQIWSLYSDDDGLPKYYARISSVTNDPVELRVNWLIPCTMPLNLIDIPWQDEEMPICCGKFKLSRGKPVSYESTYAFSHQLKAVPDTKKNVYIIIPTEGQVWALYKDWSPRLKHSELKSCKYDIVEVLEETDTGFNVLLLEQVSGFTSVFKGQVKRGSSVTAIISHAELLRFSHHIPAFRLTEEKEGMLRGFWELDPLALPVYLFAD